MMQVTRPVRLCYLVLPFLLLLCCGLLLAQDEESSGRQAELAGKLREALKHYVAALQSAPDGSDADQRLREKIISLAQRIRPTPAVPEEARRHFVMGNTYMKDAKAPQDYNQAILEYKQALLVSPWFADAYNNLGIGLQAAGNYANAERTLKMYLETKPSDSDARAAQDRIYEIEAKVNEEQQAQRDAEVRQRAQVRAEQERREKLAWLVRSWNLKSLTIVPGYGIGRTSWGTFEFVLKDHTIEGYKLETRDSHFGKAPQNISNPKAYLVLRGELQTDDPSSIRWTRPADTCDTLVEVSLDVSYDKSKITFSLPEMNKGDTLNCGDEYKQEYSLTR